MGKTETMTAKVVGVTFPNEDGENRQDIIRDLYETWGRDLSCAEVELKRYEYMWAPAYHVVINGRVVGNLAETLAASIANLEDNQGYSVWAANPYIVGGPTDDEDEDVEEIKFGMTIKICRYKPQDLQPKREPNAAETKIEQKTSPTSAERPRPASGPVSDPEPVISKTRHIWMPIVGGILLTAAAGLFAQHEPASSVTVCVALGGFFFILWAIKNR